MKLKFKYFYHIALFGVLVPLIAFAQKLEDVVSKPLEQAAGSQGAQLGSSEAVPLVTFVGRIINVGLSFIGVYFLVRVIYAGYLWFTAQGNADQTKKAKQIITQGIIGFIIIMLAGIIVLAVTDFFFTSG